MAWSVQGLAAVRWPTRGGEKVIPRPTKGLWVLGFGVVGAAQGAPEQLQLSLRVAVRLLLLLLSL